MTKEQQKHLLSRLQQIVNNKRYTTPNLVPEEVTEAREIVHTYEQTKYRLEQARLNLIEKAKVKLLDTIMFSDNVEILQQLQAFEAQQF